LNGKRKTIAIGLACVLVIASVTVVAVLASSKLPSPPADLADKMILRPGDLNVKGTWIISKDMSGPGFPQENQSSYQFGDFWYNGVHIRMGVVVWNSTDIALANYHYGQDHLDNITQSGISQATENISVGDHGYRAKVFDYLWEVTFTRGNVTAFMTLEDHAIGFLPGHDERSMLEVSMAVALVQDLKIQDYRSSIA
jgi:hypothetical protein